MRVNSGRKVNIEDEIRIAFLHHSTGQNIWNGNRSTPFSKIVRKIKNKIFFFILNKKPDLPKLFQRYNKDFNSNYIINEFTFPKSAPYVWHNYPYDYYNIWVKNAGDSA